jgi:hypothetical protein
MQREDHTMEALTAELAMAGITLNTKIQAVQQKAAQLAGEKDLAEQAPPRQGLGRGVS